MFTKLYTQRFNFVFVENTVCVYHEHGLDPIQILSLEELGPALNDMLQQGGEIKRRSTGQGFGFVNTVHINWRLHKPLFTTGHLYKRTTRIREQYPQLTDDAIETITTMITLDFMTVVDFVRWVAPGTRIRTVKAVKDEYNLDLRTAKAIVDLLVL
jgi:hypothetical protein